MNVPLSPEQSNMALLLKFRAALGWRSVAWATRNMEMPKYTLLDWNTYRRRLPAKYHRRVELFIDLYT